jgi:hypothetical protein
LLDSLIDGYVIDPAFAVTGDLNADGSVQPIGGVSGKIRGATRAKCTRVAIPIKNASSANDLILTDGTAPFTGIQVFTITTFDEAKALAIAAPEGNLGQALAQFDQLRPALNAPTLNPATVAGLAQILKLAPNHLSAKLLLDRAQRRIPPTLSAAGSAEAVDRLAGALIKAARSTNTNDQSALKKDLVATQISQLRSIREKVHPLAKAPVDTLITYGDLVRRFVNNPPTSDTKRREMVNELNSAGRAAHEAWKGFISNREVVEEQM